MDKNQFVGINIGDQFLSHHCADPVSRTYADIFLFYKLMYFSFVTQALRCSFQTKERLVFVMEYVNGGEVSDYLD